MARGTFTAGVMVGLGLMMNECTSSAVECDCVDTALAVTVPDDRAADVESITPSGPACTGVVATCSATIASGACNLYRVAPNATGACYVAVLFSSGAAMFFSESEIVEGDACCGGFVASPPSGAEIDVPGENDAAVDDGATSGDL
jgi:hypothetical protein